MNFLVYRDCTPRPVCHLHPVPNRHENSTTRQGIWKAPRVLEIWCLGIGVLHGCSLPISTGIPWRNHSTTATSGSLCCHRWSFQRSLATSSRCSLCSVGHWACRRAEHLATHSLVSISDSPKSMYCFFVQHTKPVRKVNGCSKVLHVVRSLDFSCCLRTPHNQKA
jgi:hypothetical protein